MIAVGFLMTCGVLSFNSLTTDLVDSFAACYIDALITFGYSLIASDTCFILVWIENGT